MTENELNWTATNAIDVDFLRNVLDGIRDAIKIIDRGFNVVYANNAALVMSGKPLDQVIGHGRKCHQEFYGNVGHCSFCVASEVLRNGQPAFNTLKVFKEGKSSYKEISVYPLTDKNGRVAHLIEIVRDVTELKKNLSQGEEFAGIISRDPAMRPVFELMESVAPTNSTALIYGETGVGKELVARAIHQASKRASKRFVAINCGSLPDTLLETELFGHEKGAFTGAESRRIGKFELADRGTLFLDEVGTISPNMQVKILRVLQEGELTRVGGNDTIKVDVRYILATNIDLREAVKKGEFREDLYYRINVVPISIPPLRERKEDIQTLAEYYLEKFNAAVGKNIRGFTTAALEQMREYPWPGNVRELGNLIERAVILCKGQYIEKIDISKESAGAKDVLMAGGTLQDAVDRAEAEYLLGALKKFHGSISDTAEYAGVNTRTIHRKMQQFGLKKEQFKD